MSKQWRQLSTDDRCVTDGEGNYKALCYNNAIAAQIIREHNARNNLLAACKRLAIWARAASDSVICRQTGEQLLDLNDEPLRQAEDAIAKAETKPV